MCGGRHRVRQVRFHGRDLCGEGHLPRLLPAEAAARGAEPSQAHIRSPAPPKGELLVGTAKFPVSPEAPPERGRCLRPAGADREGLLTQQRLRGRGHLRKGELPRQRARPLRQSLPALPHSPFCRCATFSPGAGEIFPQRERPWHGGKVSGLRAKCAVSPEAPPLGELSPQVTERARLLPETQQLLSRTLIRRCAPPSPDWGKASASAARFPACMQSVRFCQRLPLWGSCHRR